MSSSRRQRSLAPWVGLASVVHLLIWAGWRGRSAPERGVKFADEVISGIEFEVLPPNESQAAVVEPAVPHAESAVPELEARAPRFVSREVVASPKSERLGPTSPPDSEALGAPLATDAVVTSGQRAEAGTPQTLAGQQFAPSPTAPALQAPAERLAALGYGAPNAAALRPLLDVAPTAVAEERLNQHLAQAIVESDRDRSMGIEGPVTNAIHTAAMSVVVPKSLSKVALTIGRDGKLADFRIIETNRDARALKALGDRVKRLLANQTVRVPNGRAMEFIYEVKSEVLLPSGRAPGLAVEALGIPLKEGRDEKSSKISILTPHLQFKSHSEADPERNGKVTQTPPQLVWGISILGLDADAVDIGAPERQVVHTRLIQQRVL